VNASSRSIVRAGRELKGDMQEGGGPIHRGVGHTPLSCPPSPAMEVNS
jgi:hypothetical protein